jgi:two-component system, NarL family, sensor histidine kinase DesK
VMCLALGESGMGSSVYIAVGSMMFLPTRVAAAVTVLIAVVAEVLATRIEGWESDFTLSFSICVAALATWGITQLMNRNVDLLLAREENARLAVEEERNRMARDLHDILGHSLTVITVKAELAGRLMDADPARARAEVADLERLSRDALVDVRRAVEGFRELTLPGELARAREALRSAGIEADLPGSAEDVPSDMREVFAWAVREGVTNVIRHSGATRCTVRLAPERVEVLDNGSGARVDVVRPGPGGHGLAGLRERATAVGATLLTRTLEPQGFSMAIVTESI